jgi:chemotaxis protein histidine kinase CheA
MRWNGRSAAITMRLPLTVTVLEGFAMTVGDETYVTRSLLPVDESVSEVPRNGRS